MSKRAEILWKMNVALAIARGLRMKATVDCFLCLKDNPERKISVDENKNLTLLFSSYSKEVI